MKPVISLYIIMCLVGAKIIVVHPGQLPSRS